MQGWGDPGGQGALCGDGVPMVGTQREDRPMLVASGHSSHLEGQGTSLVLVTASSWWGHSHISPCCHRTLCPLGIATTPGHCITLGHPVPMARPLSLATMSPRCGPTSRSRARTGSTLPWNSSTVWGGVTPQVTLLAAPEVLPVPKPCMGREGSAAPQTSSILLGMDQQSSKGPRLGVQELGKGQRWEVAAAAAAVVVVVMAAMAAAIPVTAVAPVVVAVAVAVLTTVAVTAAAVAVVAAVMVGAVAAVVVAVVAGLWWQQWLWWLGWQQWQRWLRRWRWLRLRSTPAAPLQRLSKQQLPQNRCRPSPRLFALAARRGGGWAVLGTPAAGRGDNQCSRGAALAEGWLCPPTSRSLWNSWSFIEEGVSVEFTGEGEGWPG